MSCKLTVEVLRARYILALDPNGRSDPYCILSIDGTAEQQQKTEIMSATLEPQWNMPFQFTVTPPHMWKPDDTMSGGPVSHYFKLEMWDHDMLNRDDFMGMLILPLVDISDSKAPQWYKLTRNASKQTICGEIKLKVYYATSTLSKWKIHQELQLACKSHDFNIPVQCGDKIVDYPGDTEYTELCVKGVFVEISSQRSIAQIFLTNYRLVILCEINRVRLQQDGGLDLSMWIGLGNIMNVEKSDDKTVRRAMIDASRRQTDSVTLTISCHDFRIIKLTFTGMGTTSQQAVTKFTELGNPVAAASNYTELKNENAVYSSIYFDQKQQRFVYKAHSSVQGDGHLLPPPLNYIADSLYIRLMHIVANIGDISPAYQFLKKNTDSLQLTGWDLYNYPRELDRQKVSKDWELSATNGPDYKICQTYPQLLYFPKSCEHSTIVGSSKFRSKGRLPCLVWCHRNQNFMLRCAQPLSGATGKSSTDDETLIYQALKTSPNKQMVIFDARSVLAAGGNKLMGKGTEDVSRYAGCKLVHLDIPNIHTVRESLDQLKVVCNSPANSKWLSSLENTQWLFFISLILKGSVMVVRSMEKQSSSVLVHCSDGWDRTSQLTSLSQLMMDSYYRTINGFIVLIEKEWLSFGHKFKERLGNSTSPNERSPIFLQFLDCVWQIQRQYPAAFEFTSKFLLAIADHLHTLWFGTFLVNSDKERNDSHLLASTMSLWAYILAAKNSFMNDSYYPSDEEILIPEYKIRRLQLWNEYFLRFDVTSFSGKDLDEEETTIPQTHMVSSTVVWASDEQVSECKGCKREFTVLRRKHHCRACGNIFCNQCTSQQTKVPKLGYYTAVRVCDPCHKRIIHNDFVLVNPDKT